MNRPKSRGCSRAGEKLQIGVMNADEQTRRTDAAIARRACEIFESNGRGVGREPENWFKAEKEFLHPVLVNITELEESFEVKAEVPGFNEKEIEIAVEPRRLTITGKRETKKEEKKGKTIWAETCSDQILRIVDLPSEIETVISVSLNSEIERAYTPWVQSGYNVSQTPQVISAKIGGVTTATVKNRPQLVEPMGLPPANPSLEIIDRGSHQNVAWSTIAASTLVSSSV